MSQTRSAALNNAVQTRKRPENVTPKRILLSRTLLILSALILMLIGLVMIYSASSVEAIAEGNNPASYLISQSQWIVIGTVACIIAARIPYSVWSYRVLYWALWGLVVCMLIVTAVAGYVGLGAQRWFSIGSFSFQPSELAKVAVILALTATIAEYAAGRIPKYILALKVIIIIVIPAALIYVQPDLGTTIIVIVAALLTLWFGGINWKLLLAGLIACTALGIIGIVTEPYRLTRFTTFLHPFEDPEGDGYQIINSLYAFGSGGIFGVGLGNSYQKYSYLPEAHTDFIFSIIGEELGLFGALFVILLFAVFVWAGCRIASDSKTLSGRAIAGASTGIIGFQALINIACTVGFFPVTGKPLPFVSAGGSSLLATLILVGLILSVSFHTSSSSAAQIRRDNLLVIDGGADIDRAAGKQRKVRDKKPAAAVSAGKATRATMKVLPDTVQKKTSSKSVSRISLERSSGGSAKSQSQSRVTAKTVKQKSVTSTKNARGVSDRAASSTTSEKAGASSRKTKVSEKTDTVAQKARVSSRQDGPAKRQPSSSGASSRQSNTEGSSSRGRRGDIQLADSRRGRDKR